MTPGRIVIIVSASLLALFLIFSAYLLDNEPSIVTKERSMMGTIVKISVPVNPSADLRAVNSAIEKAFDEIDRVEGLFSGHRKDSVISAINKLGASRELVIPAEVFDLIELSVEYGSITEGAFDITVKPLIDLWSHARADNALPAEAQIAEAIAKTGYRDIELNRDLMTISFKKSGMALDCGAVAKGYASDRAIHMLTENSIDNAIVNCGGDMYCLGSRSKKHPWSVAIQHPRKSDEQAFLLQLTNRAVDTSGDYEKFFIINGKRYSHIIDPRTGYPVGDSIISATAVAADSKTADIFATALCILGRPGLLIAARHGVDALIIVQDNGKLYTDMTEGFERQYNAEKKSEL